MLRVQRPHGVESLDMCPTGEYGKTDSPSRSARKHCSSSSNKQAWFVMDLDWRDPTVESSAQVDALVQHLQLSVEGPCHLLSRQTPPKIDVTPLKRVSPARQINVGCLAGVRRHHQRSHSCFQIAYFSSLLSFEDPSTKTFNRDIGGNKDVLQTGRR